MSPAVIALLFGTTVTLLSLAVALPNTRRQRVLGRLGALGDVLIEPAPSSPDEPILQKRRRGGKGSGGPDRAERIQRELERAGVQLKSGEYQIARFAFAGFLITAGLFLRMLWLVPALGLVGYFLPRLYVRRRLTKRLARIESQLVEALSLLSNALKAGFSLMQGIDAVANQIGGPLGLELRQLIRDTAMGVNAEDAVKALAQRVGSYELDIVATAIVVQRTVGGNLSEILEHVAETLRERERIRGEITTLTSQQRMTAYILAALPIVLGGLFSLINAEYMAPLFTSMAGKVMLVAAGMMELVGMFIIKRIVAIDV